MVHRSQPIDVEHDGLAAFGRVGLGEDHAIGIGGGRRQVAVVAEFEDTRRVSVQRHGVNRAGNITQPHGHLDRRLSLELPRDLHVHLARADEGNVARQAESSAIEADAHGAQ